MSDVIRWTCEMVRSDIGGFVSNHDYQMAVEECDRLRAALSERDRILGDMADTLRHCIERLNAEGWSCPDEIAVLSAYDASKKEKV